MTKDEVTNLGIAAQRARDIFEILGQENTKIDPAERVAQTAQYERARTEMHADEAIHRIALTQIDA